ncbi:hypothetical protein ACVBEH_25665, partial [Roseateles sp. GG27B]
MDSDGLAVDTVNQTVGISRSADVTLQALSQDLTLAAAMGAGTLRLQAQAGSVVQTGGLISATTLGANAHNSVTLGSSNAVTSTVAARAETGNLLFKNGNGYQVGAVAADGTAFTAVDGLTAAAADKNITLDTSAGLVTQAVG